jgi:hypothetical protein
VALGWGNNTWGDYGWGGAIPITGVVAAGVVGTVEHSKTVALSGVSSTGGVGDVVETNSGNGIGDAAFGSVGSVTNSQTIALSGVSTAGEVGTILAGKVYGITGVEATGEVGDVVETNTGGGIGDLASGFVGIVEVGRTVAISGIEATGAVDTVVNGATVAISGVSATGAVNQIIVPLPSDLANCEVGTVTTDRVMSLTSANASGSVDSVALGARSFALTGNYAAGDVGVVIAVYWKLIDDMQVANWQNIDNV